ncbi:S-adenosylmethionine mitochondrial carrier protein isoform X3 [Perca fluviatilis]|uniref:S-adenosylmethionine mitochondrial carrier protein isoform X3 n=1 Tax=Perca fluviatilis TaxID=8168 RepID=UPI001963B26F|nr:S-adenosylmethionine mitochondrial carrier protein isoform X3 [Perca fluviatilis]XP_039654457.1 S-adenosylmethionine mitochondrial carrier protein isoform X3 [Perca fluviatilis]
MERREFVASLVAGGSAGMCVDLTLFPLDTIKTRLQSQQGFYKAGGFRGIYAGVPSAAIGSFPNAAAFFVTYECTKSLLGAGEVLAAPHVAPVTHMLAASLGEIVACLIRVPTEVVKQRTQASPSSTTYQMLLATLREEGVRGLYRGYRSTVLREMVQIERGEREWMTHSRAMCRIRTCAAAKDSAYMGKALPDPVLAGAVSTLGIFKDSVVMEARSHALLLAGCSVRSFCRCSSCICYHSS